MKMSTTISNSDFKDYIEKRYYYVDKTSLIEELFNKGDQVILLPRPRRFGKTLNLSMLKYYFDINENSKELFKGTKIEEINIYEKHLNKYPTIFLTFKDIKGKNYEEDYIKIKQVVADLYERYEYLSKSDKLNDRDKKYFNNILNEEEADYSISLMRLSKFLYKYYGKKVVILIDEYDTPLNKELDNEHYKSIINFLRDMISTTFKGNEYLFKGVITGILRIAKESVFSGANNIMVRTILDDDFIDKFGFTEGEVIKILEYYDIKYKIEEVRKWYNGYTFGKNVIYNPFSIASYVQKRKLEAYWVGTGDDTLIRNLINKTDAKFKGKIDILINGGAIQEYIEDNIVFDKLNDPQYLWSLLLFSGYLKAKHVDRKIYELKIPNEEVKDVYKYTMMSYFESIVDNSNEIIDAILADDIDILKGEIESLTLNKLSYYDNSESFYHGLYYGVLLRLETKDYEIKSNRESGGGRYDIAIIPKGNNRTGYIIEFKVLKGEDKNTKDLDLIKMKLKKLAEDAIKQIEEKKYTTELIQKGVKNIIILGIAFKGKNIDIFHKTISL